jgi:NTP pyrophosphatase (non-canonical NTP hydrolase)
VFSLSGDVLMNLKQYQKLAVKTVVYPDRYKVFYPALALCGEAGEVANKVKKLYRGDYSLLEAREAIADELGDVLWYIAVLAHDLGYDLEEIGTKNIEKLAKRSEQGTIYDRNR